MPAIAMAMATIAPAPPARAEPRGHRRIRRLQEVPRAKEQKFAAALNAGNPEVAPGKTRHGMFYDGGVYWAPEPLSFIYYNMVIA